MPLSRCISLITPVAGHTRMLRVNSAMESGDLTGHIWSIEDMIASDQKLHSNALVGHCKVVTALGDSDYLRE